MKFDRRAFLRSASFALFGLAMVPRVAVAARARVSVRAIPLSVADTAVLQWISTYSSKVRMVGGCVLSKIRGGDAETRFLVEVADSAKLQEVLGSVLPFSNVYARGNLLQFTFEGQRYAVENLLPQLFAPRVTALAAARRVAFAHDALIYDPTTQRLNDPYRALASAALNIVYPGAGMAAAFYTVLRGWIEADQFNLKHGVELERLRRRVLRVPGKRLGLARPVLAVLVSQLTTLADILTAEQIAALIRSPLVSVAISRVLGVSVNTVIAQFADFRVETGADGGDAAAWLASLLAEQLNKNTLPDWLRDLDPVSAYRARVALASAREVAGRRAANQ